MKAFSVFFVIFLHGVGSAIECPQGFKGPLCVEKCSLFCNSGMCDWRNETEVCICDESKWTGSNCEEPRPCASAKCNHGKCEPYNNTLIPFICICNEGYKGDRCDEPIIDLCIGQSKISCDNEATCVNNQCVCKDGFGGERCENIVPLREEYANSRCNTSCAAVFANNKCDENCNTAECFYDGLDCFEKPEIDEEDTDRMDLGSTNCLYHYGNGVCDKDCNSYQYGFDGGDCEKELRGTVKGRIMISLGVNPSVLNLSHKFLLAYLAQILRAGVSVSKRGKDNIPEVYSIVRSTGIEEHIILDDSLPDRYDDFTKLILDVDTSYCNNETWKCLRINRTDNSIQPISFPSRSVMVSFVVKDVSVVEVSSLSCCSSLTNVIQEPTAAWIEIFLTVIISMLITLTLSFLILACWFFRRRRRNSKTSKDGGRTGHLRIDHHKNRLVDAVEEGNVSSLTTLLSEVTPIEAANAEDVAGNTVLHMAASRDDKEMVQLLLQSRMFDVCSVNSIGQSPLLYSLREGKPGLETLELLVNAINDAKLRHRTTSQNTRAASNHLMLTALSEEPGWGLTDAVGRSALHHAALAGRPRHIIHFLVSHGASPGLQDASGNTPLHLAAINGHSETVHALLDERATVTVTNSLGNTPAHVCALNGHSNLANLLFEKEYEVNSAPIRSRHDSQRGNMYSTAESLFSDEPDEFVLPSLLSFGADLTPLMAAASSGGCGEGSGCGGRLSLSGIGGNSILGGPNSTISGSADPLLSTPTPKLPHILTPSSQLVEVSPDRVDSTPSTLPRKCLYGVERSPSDPRPSQLSSPYGTVYGKRRSLPDGPSITSNYRDVLLSPVHFMYASNTMSSTSERSQSSAGHDSLVSSFRPP
ncbi:hypothetical protein PMAYCL1PPCAC_00106, partial [Pristionchus mayeri]